MKKSVAKLQAYQPEEPVAVIKSRYHLDKLARLSANESVYGPSLRVKAALKAINLDQLNYYPDGSAAKLRQAVAELNQVDPASLVFGAGEDELIQILTRLALEPGQNIVVPGPTFGEYGIHAQIEQATTKTVPVQAQDGHVNFTDLLAAVDDQTAMVWLANPNNPTGVFEAVDQIEEFLQQLPAQVYFVVDEAYIDFVQESHSSVIPLLATYPNLIVLRTLSKAYGLANLRVGYGIMDQNLARQLNAVRLPYNLSDFQIEAGTAAVLDQDYLAEVVGKVEVERKKMTDFLTKQGFFFYQSATNFLWVAVGDAHRYGEALLAAGFQISQRLSSTWIRITIGQAEDNQILLALLADLKNDDGSK